MNGLLVLDKPTGITSRDAVNRVQKLLPRRLKLGHTGTLDPLATGVLVLCLGNATRLAEYVQEREKTYRSRFRLGATSDTDDAAGTVTERSPVEIPTESSIRDCLMEFVGRIDQVPPAYSAAHVNGQRAYAQARRGREVELAARTVRVDRIEVLNYDYPFLDLEIDCGKGTYIRSLARDLGEQLNCGGLVQELRRTRIGPFVAEMALKEFNKTGIASALIPMERAVEHLPEMQLSLAEIQLLKNGQFLDAPSELPMGQEYRLYDSIRELHGIGYIHEPGELRASKMFL